MSAREFLRDQGVGIAVLAIGAALAIVYQAELKEWFGVSEEAQAHATHADAGTVYTCSMHPSVRQTTPGTCPLCAMALTQVSDQRHDGSIVLDAAHRERAGVKTSAVESKPLSLVLRVVGEVAFDETRLSDVSLRVGGFVEKLFVDATGDVVKKGAPLLTLWSPELLAAQREHVTALGRMTALDRTTSLGRSDTLVAASRQRLGLLGMSAAQIEKLEAERVPLESITVSAPSSGHVIEKEVVAGARIEPGMRLYRIAALDKVWIKASVQERDLMHVKTGMPVTVHLPGDAQKAVQARIALIDPGIDVATRSASVRIELPNVGLELRPGQYVDVELAVELGDKLVVPESAVLYTGPRKLVFVEGEGERLEPREVQLGLHSQGVYEVLGGLKAGERVVTAGNFLVAAESRIRSTTTLFEADHAEHE